MKHLFIISLFVFLFVSCKKDKKDTTPPVINMSLPVSGTTYNMFDTIPIAASFSDETQLTRAEISFRDMNGISVQPGFTINLSGKSFNLNEELPLHEFRIPTGNYNIDITVSDGENASTKSTTVHIIESPYERKGFYFFAKDGSQHSITKTDTNFALISAYSIGGTHVSSEISNYDQIIYAASSINWPFRAISIADGTTKWSLGNPGTAATITSTCFDGKNIFLGKDDGNVYKINQDGTPVRSYLSGEMTYYVKAVFYCGDYIVVSLFDFNSTSKKTVVFEISSGIIKKVIQNSEVKAAFQKSSGELYLLSVNSSNRAIIEVYTVLTNNMNQVVDFGVGNITSACQVSNNILIVGLSNGNVYYYQNSSGVYLSVLSGIQCQKMIYSPKFNRLHLSSYKNFYSYSVNSFALNLQNSHASPDTIIDFQVIQNK